jgi:hypothetical protein
MKNLRPKLLRTVVPKVAHYCGCNDQFALDMYRLQLEQDSDSGDARARRKNS